MEQVPPEQKPDPKKDQTHLKAVHRPTGTAYRDPEHVFWRQIAEASTPKEFCQSWLPLQCRMLKNVRCAIVLLDQADQGSYTPVAVWPDAKLGMQHLTGAAERSLKERRGLLIEKDPDPESPNHFPENFHLAYPIEVDGRIHGTVVLGLDETDRTTLQAVMRQLHWGAAWLEIAIRRRQAAASNQINHRLQVVLDLVTSAVEHDSYHEAVLTFVTHTASRLECDRVAIGFSSGRHVRVAAMSHSADSGIQTNLMLAIGAAMDESVDQKAVVVYPPLSDALPLVNRAHTALVKQHGAGAICTIPLEKEGKYIGALTLERPSDRPFEPDSVQVCETVAALVGAVLETKRREERWLALKAYDAVIRQLKRLLGPGHLLRKLVALAVIGLAVFFTVFEIDYRVTAPTVIEGAIQRVVASPFDGYIREAPIRPGDLVKEGDLLGYLDDRDLKLQHRKWSTEKEQYLKQYSEAMAKHDRPQIRVLRAKVAQAEAQIALLEEQLNRCRIRAPFDGVIMSGDLSQSLGSPVERGQVLFEVAPLNAYRIVVEVDERDIAEIKVGQESELIMPSMPGKSFAFKVEKITPVSTAKEGRNYFRVEAHLAQTTERLRPGMEGIGKITVERRKLIWVWTHRAIDWMRLQLWRWMP